MVDNVVIRTVDSIRIIQLNHSNCHNPFSRELEDAVKTALRAADTDDTVAAIIVTGGEGRSFSVGGDFNEVKNLTGGDDVDEWIDRVIALYVAALTVTKPTLAAIDGHAIGMGFQFAMMFDWRLMADTGIFRMPELKYGIGCTVGAAILECVVSFNAMRAIIVGCEPIDATAALRYDLVNEVVPAETLMTRAVAVAQLFAAYPAVSFRSTKAAMVDSLQKALYAASDRSKQTHRSAFRAKSALNHFDNILGEKNKH